MNHAAGSGTPRETQAIAAASTSVVGRPNMGRGWRHALHGELKDEPQRALPGRYLQWKHVVERPLALVLLLLSLPLIALLVLLTRLSSRGPGIFRQVRVGLDGRLFTMYKIRSMRQDAEVQTGAVWAVENDPRMTWLGAWLRKLHLDELPQLYNVVRGEMSLVGPRPERPEFVNLLSDLIEGYDNRLVVRPGITGLAQVALAPDTDLDSVRRKLVLDLRYVARGCPWLDARILAYTAARVMKMPPSWLSWLLGLRGSMHLAPADLTIPGEQSPGAPYAIAAGASHHAVHDGNGHAAQPLASSRKPR